MKTTLAAIRKAGPCSEGWTKLYKSLGGIKKFGLNTEFDITHIIHSNGLDDALWVLAHACGKDGEDICHLFACDVAERVLLLFEAAYPTDRRPREAIEAKRKWVCGEISDEELDAAGAAARDAARAAWDATRDAARAAWDAWDAARAAWDAARAAARAAGAAWAAWDAARAAGAAGAARDAARAAGDAWDAGAARAAEHEWQTAHLIEMLENTK